MTAALENAFAILGGREKAAASFITSTVRLGILDLAWNANHVAKTSSRANVQKNATCLSTAAGMVAAME